MVSSVSNRHTYVFFCGRDKESTECLKNLNVAVELYSTISTSRWKTTLHSSYDHWNSEIKRNRCDGRNEGNPRCTIWQSTRETCDMHAALQLQPNPCVGKTSANPDTERIRTPLVIRCRYTWKGAFVCAQRPDTLRFTTEHPLASSTTSTCGHVPLPPRNLSQNHRIMMHLVRINSHCDWKRET